MERKVLGSTVLPAGLLGVLACLSAAGSAMAAEEQGSGSSWMLGDWGGARTRLQERGYDFNIGYVGEVAGLLDGGYSDDHIGRYSHQFAAGLHVDLEKVFGWGGAEFQLSVTERGGRNLSNVGIADPRAGQLSSVQEVWGRGQRWRLTQLWFKQKYFGDRLDLKLGRFGEGEDFNSFPCDFQNLVVCGSQMGNWAGSVWYNWPVSQWAVRAKVQLSRELALQIGAYEQNPLLLDPRRGFTLSTRGRAGTLMPVELVWSPQQFLGGLPGEYRLGYFRSTARAQDVYLDAQGMPQAISGNAFRQRASKHGAWFTAQQQLTRVDGDASRGLSLFANLTIHDKATNTVDGFQQLGAVYRGPFNARPHDDIGLGIGRIHVNDRVARRQRLLNASNDVEAFADPLYQPVQRTEYNAELYYGVHVSDWLTVRPNLQYVKDPGGVAEVDSALVLGIKLQVAL
ncbi:carbohydrate porin [Stenotrophomonas sp.]|uniref:carbohydrate porin n=1 Tax=Stenotrophomonas sp. TaxID=69392 RepID=UPI0028B130F9|nr:carbohydrate porin [Stenotrophomonas sp.]